MRILYATTVLPSFQGVGTATRAYHLLKHLSEEHKITLVCFEDTDPEVTQLQMKALEVFCYQVKVIGIKGFTTNHWALRLHTFFRTFHPLPWAVRSILSPELLRTVQTSMSEQRFDVVYADHHEMAPLLPFNDHVARVMGIEMVSPKLRLYYEQQPGMLTRFANYWEWRKMARFEGRFLPQMDVLIMTSQEEVKKLHALGHTVATAVVPNGVDVSYFEKTPVDAPQKKAQRLLYIGSMSYPPNNDAVLYFQHEIWPRLKSSYPALTWDIVGNRPSAEVQALAGADIRVLGFVPDSRPYFYESTLMIVPMRSGSGTRLKILEALAAGLPVVSTSIGAEGLDTVHGEHLLIADTPQEFAEAVACLLGDPALRARLAQNGRKLVEECYDWQAIALQLEQAFQAAVDGAGRGSD